MKLDEFSGCITDVPGVRIGHAQSKPGFTGCTVVLLEKGAIAGIDIGGSAPATRETNMLEPTNMIMRIHALMLSGGSTFGLGAANGVQKYLHEQDIGFHASTGAVIPIVPSAAIFDLDVGRPHIYPDAMMGYTACNNVVDGPTAQGSVGAGCGALCGKVLGSKQAMRGGIGTSSYTFPNGAVVGVLVVTNPWGDVINPLTGDTVAAPRDPDDPSKMIDTEEYISNLNQFDTSFFGMNTTLCAIATNAKFSREQVTKLAMMGQDGIARAIRPSHTMFDGDVVFALSLGEKELDVNIAGSIAAKLIAGAIVRAVRAANNLT